jgi:hypothetical protein
LSLSRSKKKNLEKFIDLPVFNKENLDTVSPSPLSKGKERDKIIEKKNKNKKDNILSNILNLLNKIINRKIKEKDKIKEYYTKLKKNKNTFNSNTTQSYESGNLEHSIHYNDFIRELYFNQEENKKNRDSLDFTDRIVDMEDNLILSSQDKVELNKKLEFDFNITSFKIKLGERFISFFEDYGIINQT